MLRPGTSFSSIKRSNNKSAEEKLVSQTERLLDCYYWALFKSDRGMLEHDREIDEEDKKRADGSQCPYNVVAEPQGNVNGWIAEYLQYLDFLMTCVLGSV